MTTRNAWQAISERPLGFLASSWPWRSVAYLVSGVVLGAVTLATLFVMAIGGVLQLLLVVGLPVFLGIALSGIVVGGRVPGRLRGGAPPDRARPARRRPAATGGADQSRSE